MKRTMSFVLLLLIVGGAAQADHLRLILMGDGTVRDKETGLTWERHRGSEPLAWEAAAAYCSALVLAEKEDWRLPTTEELLTLIEMGKTPPVDPVAFSDTRHALSTFWTATERGTDQALSLNMRSGFQSVQWKDTAFDIRCVRQ
jgi:serine/threonine-protein kinase